MNYITKKSIIKQYSKKGKRQYSSSMSLGMDQGGAIAVPEFDTDVSPIVRRLSVESKRLSRIIIQDKGGSLLEGLDDSTDAVHIALKEAVFRRSHELYGSLEDIITDASDLDDSTWGNEHILKFFSIRNLRGLASITLGDPWFLSLELIGPNIQRLLYLSQSPNIAQLMGQVQGMDYPGGRVYNWLANLQILTPLLHHCYFGEGHMHCYVLSCCLVQFALCSDQYIMNQANLQVPQELVEFIEISVRVTSPKLAQFSGLTHVFGKEVQQYLNEE